MRTSTRELVGILARNFQKLQVLIGHVVAAAIVRRAQAARRRFSSRESMAAAFGFTTQNLPM